MTLRFNILSNQPHFNQYQAPSAVGGENADGFVVGIRRSIGSPNLPAAAFFWSVRVQVDGRRGDPCGRILLGMVQNVVRYSAVATWQSGTRWKWSLSSPPARDGLNDNSPWYNPNYTFQVGSCGDNVGVDHGDSPNLRRNPDEPSNWLGPDIVIPWSDPRTGAQNSIVSLVWSASFDAFLMMQDQAHGRSFFQVHDSANGHSVVIGWGLDVELRFNLAMQPGQRSQLVRSSVGAAPFSRTSPKTTGPVAKLVLSQGM